MHGKTLAFYGAGSNLQISTKRGGALNHVRGAVNVLTFLCRVGVIIIGEQAVKSKRSSCVPGCKRDAAVELVGLCSPAVGSQ